MACKVNNENFNSHCAELLVCPSTISDTISNRKKLTTLSFVMPQKLYTSYI